MARHDLERDVDGRAGVGLHGDHVGSSSSCMWSKISYVEVEQGEDAGRTRECDAATPEPRRGRRIASRRPAVVNSGVYVVRTFRTICAQSKRVSGSSGLSFRLRLPADAGAVVVRWFSV